MKKFGLALVCLLWGGLARGGEIDFRIHPLNLESEFSACAVFDVNKDGKLDIICGGFWYEAPTFKKHVLREVQNIGGRFDDYSNLPLDVNGDGWPDLVSVNYRSRSLYWVEHPGKDLSIPWRKHVIDTPGTSETGRLHDVDGDGQLDILPNGTSFAAWYSLERNQDGVKWLKHDLPKEVMGHGLGFGDINGDGRGDIVAPNGWLEAPKDRRKQPWTWHADFSLDKDASIPILVEDVDGDGDNDLIWGRGHNFGLFWLEQVKSGAKVTWTKHEIDKTWSQPHALLWGDVDGDGRPDLIAGKRYLGHDGKDPGEKEPLIVCWYSFDRAKRAWQQHIISRGGKVGMDLDPKAIDLDGDGDLDLICPARCGLHWLENLRIK
ncbi:MAG: FG-GAP repeat domain-containing protein [Gemmataceae bacterium]